VDSNGIIILILGAIIGVIVAKLYDLIFANVKAWRKKVGVKRRAAQYKPGYQEAIAIKYFDRIGRLSDLYTPTHTKVTNPIPVIAEGSPTVLPAITPTSEAAIKLRSPANARKEFPVRLRTIQRQRREGARIFDGTILYVQDRTIDDGNIAFVLDRCNYYSFATKMVMLRRELRSRSFHDPIYKNLLATLSASIATTVEPQLAGCSCVTLFPATGGGYSVIFGRRSAEVAQSVNQICTLPSFGMESNVTAGQKSKYGIFFYNYLREFGEELLDLEELIELTESKRFGPDWIFNLPGMNLVEAEVIRGDLQLSCLGVSANPYDGALDFALLAQFRSSAFLPTLEAHMRANWESSTQPIEIRDLFDPEIDEWVQVGMLDNCSAFAIDLARAKIAGGNASPSQLNDKAKSPS
jgi:hypothetical protein